VVVDLLQLELGLVDLSLPMHHMQLPASTQSMLSAYAALPVLLAQPFPSCFLVGASGIVHDSNAMTKRRVTGAPDSAP
jgi:hypothetical protein